MDATLWHLAQDIGSSRSEIVEKVILALSKSSNPHTDRISLAQISLPFLALPFQNPTDEIHEQTVRAQIPRVWTV
jgi:hypothetical protein